MTPDIVVDIGNSRMKWGRCERGRVAEMASLPLDDAGEWAIQLRRWGTGHPIRWALASVNPPITVLFREWTRVDGSALLHLDSYRSLPLKVEVDEPARVGIDRLLGVVAAQSLTPKGEPAITVDVGTAVTVNLLDGSGTFLGGAIFPGPRLMSQSLSRETVALPSTDLREVPAVAPPARNTVDAIRAGVAAAIQGGVGQLLTRLSVHHPWPWLFITGGARGSLSKQLFPGTAEVHEIPHLTLEGIRLAAEALP